jgi:hypothetical protein
MTELEMKNQAESEREDFTEELSDEALDRSGEGGEKCNGLFCTFSKVCNSKHVRTDS